MATYYPTNKQGSAKQDNIGGVSVVGCVWEIGSATLGTADVLAGPTVPAGSVIVGVSLTASDCDTGTTLTLDVGDATDDNRLMAAAAVGVGESSVDMAAAGSGYKYTAATRIDVTPAAAAQGGVAGGTIALELRYIVLEPTT